MRQATCLMVSDAGRAYLNFKMFFSGRFHFDCFDQSEMTVPVACKVTWCRTGPVNYLRLYSSRPWANREKYRIPPALWFAKGDPSAQTRTMSIKANHARIRTEGSVLLV